MPLALTQLKIPCDKCEIMPAGQKLRTRFMEYNEMKAYFSRKT